MRAWIDIFSVLLSIDMEWPWLVHNVTLTFEGVSKLSHRGSHSTLHSHWQYTWVPNSSNFPSTIICCFDYCHPSMSGVSNCGLYLNSPSGWQSWGFSPVHIDHFSILSGKMSIYLISRVKLGCLSFHCCVAKLFGFILNMLSSRMFHLTYIIWMYSSCC